MDVCTTAYDTYMMPAPIDPVPLFTYGGGIVPTPSPDPYLLNQCVLWAPFPRLMEATLSVGFNPEDVVPTPVDTSCSLIMQLPWALGYVALLNDPAYYLLPKLTPPLSTPPMFITAKNLAPIPPGPETIIVLHVAISGESSFQPAMATKHGNLTLDLHGSSKFIAAAGPPPVVLAAASMTGGFSLSASATVQRGARSTMRGFASIQAFMTGADDFDTVLEGSSSMTANCTVRRAARATLAATSMVASLAHVRRGVSASPQGASLIVGTMKARWAGHAHPTGLAAVAATARITHKAEAFLTGSATVTAVPT